jgi:hypothetical protein
VGVPHGLRLLAALTSAALDRHLLHTDAPIPLATIAHHSRVGRPAIGILENPLEHGVVRPLDDDQTPRPLHFFTVGEELGSLQEIARTLPRWLGCQGREAGSLREPSISILT